MKKLYQLILAIFIVATSSSTLAAGNDYAAVYKSWNAILSNEPDTLISEIHIEIQSPFCIDIKATNKKDKVAKQLINDEALAVAINDSVWFVNTTNVKRNYTGVALPFFKHYAPLYFNDKVAYLQFSDEIDDTFLYNLSAYVSQGASTVEALRFLTSYGFNMENAFLFTIDPKAKSVDALNSERMSQLLTPYLDLRKRYESMYFFEEPFVINYYFLEYIDIIATDDEIPYLLQ